MENLRWWERIRSWLTPRAPRPPQEHDAPSGEGLLAAARRGDWQTVNNLLALGTPPDAARTRHGETALWLACHYGFKKVAESLLAAGADPRADDGTGATCLFRAAIGGHTSIIELMAVARPEVFLTESAALALRRAVTDRRPDIVFSLLEGGTPVYARPPGYPSAMFVAAICSAPCLAVLFQFGADPAEVDERGRTALHHAAAADHHSCIAMMLTAGADVSVRDNDGRRPADLAVSPYVRRWLLPLLPVNGQAVFSS